MNTADLITAFLNNEMSPEQEREFLLSVAASDSQRLALKSHVLMDRVLTSQVQRASVPAQVRNTIFAAAVASFAEPLPEPSSAPAAKVGLMSRLRGVATRAVMPAMVSILTIAGFGIGYYTGADHQESGTAIMSAPLTPQQNPVSSVTPSVSEPLHESVTAPPAALQTSAQSEDVAATSNPAMDHVLREQTPVVTQRHRQTSDVESATAAKPTAQPSVGTQKSDLPASPSDNVSSSSTVDTKETSTSVDSKEQGANPTVQIVTKITRPSKDTSSTNRGNHRE